MVFLTSNVWDVASSNNCGPLVHSFMAFHLCECWASDRDLLRLHQHHPRPAWFHWDLGALRMTTWCTSWEMTLCLGSRVALWASVENNGNGKPFKKLFCHMGVSIHGYPPPKWMVYKGNQVGKFIWASHVGSNILPTAANHGRRVQASLLGSNIESPQFASL